MIPNDVPGTQELSGAEEGSDDLGLVIEFLPFYWFPAIRAPTILSAII